MKTKMVTFVFCVSFLTAPLLATDEPNDIQGTCYATSGTIDSCGECPAWFLALNRKSTDTHQEERLIVHLDACTVFGEYEVITVEQSSPSGFSVDLKENDIFVEWDEDDGDGSRRSFTFSGSYVEETPDYVHVTSTNNNIINWTVCRVTAAGTLTITNTEYNEHDIFRITHNVMEFTKSDNLSGQCASPDQTITYSICFDNAFGQTLQDPFIIDWLPEDVEYPGGFQQIVLGDPNDPNAPLFTVIPPDPGYNEEDHSYVWFLDDIDPNSSGCVQLGVVVKDTVPPGGFLHNVAELWGTVMVADPNDPNTLTPEVRFVAKAVLDTPVCCYVPTPEILYVDRDSSGGNGASWTTAFSDLQDALDYARTTVCDEVQSIYVAQGTYFPGDHENDSFDLTALPGIALYGGFPSGGCDFSLRNPKRYQTILSGKIDNTHRNSRVVIMGDNTFLDGFTITECGLDLESAGIYALGVDFAIVNSFIANNLGYGAYMENCNAEFQWVTFRGNDLDGIYHQGEGFELTVSNCWIRQSRLNGIACQDSTPSVTNSVVTESDLALEGRAGIFMINPSATPRLHNLTIAHNKTMGVGLMGSRLPEIRNSIVYHNGDEALVGFSADDAAHYSCIEDCNSVNNNINVDPELSYFDPNNVRIALGSPCHDSGLTVQEHYSQFDMDSRARVLGVAVDRGAYEIDCEDTSNMWDWNADGLVNYSEFNGFSKAWMGHDPNDPAWLANPAIRDPNLSEGWYEWKYKYNVATGGESAYSIDLADVLYFAEESPWLWRACWVNPEDVQMQQMTLSGGEELMMFAQSELLTEMPVIEEKSVQEQMLDLASTILFLEQIWLEEPDLQQQISAEDWQELMDTVYQNMLDLQARTVQIE